MMVLLMYLARLQNSSGFAVLSGCFQCDVSFGVSVKHSEEIVVRAGHYDAEKRREAVLLRGVGG